MKKILLVVIGLVSITQYTHGKNLNAFFSFCIFDQPGKSPYVETYLNVDGSSVKLAQNAESKWQGKIEVQWVYKQNDKIVHFDKYNLLGPAVASTSVSVPDFIDQQRVPLSNGNYILELKITDKNSADNSYSITQPVTINYADKGIHLSDIEFVESYTPTVTQGAFSKNGYDIVPLVYNYFPKTLNTLKFYTEIYLAKEVLGDEDILLGYRISGHQNNKIINNLVGFKKQKASSVNILLAELPISDVTSGNYYLEIEARDKTNQLLGSKKIVFQRSKPFERPMSIDDLSLIKIDNTFVSYMTNNDTLKDYIASLYPISAQFESNVEENVLKTNNLESMQQFFYYFWSKRNVQDPEQAWLSYQAEVSKVNVSFKSLNKKGYDTDRGRVYLQYGPPNEIYQRYSEPETFPYEIWHYNTIGNQSDGKFVFYSRNTTSNDFELLHSNVNGEYNNPNWTNNLASDPRSLIYNTKDENGTNKQVNRDKFGNRALEEFNHPK